MAALPEKEIKKRMKFANLDLLNETFHQGKSVSLYMGHYCNLKWISTIAMYLDPPIFIGQIYRTINHSNLISSCSSFATVLEVQYRKWRK